VIRTRFWVCALCNRTGRSAQPGLRAPACCFTEPTRLKSTRDSTHRWMKVGAQVTFAVVQLAFGLEIMID
jgi:hypothetical protein